MTVACWLLGTTTGSTSRRPDRASCPRVPFGYQPPWTTASTSVGGLEPRCASRREATRARSGPHNVASPRPRRAGLGALPGLSVSTCRSPPTCIRWPRSTGEIGGAMAETVRQGTARSRGTSQAAGQDARLGEHRQRHRVVRLDGLRDVRRLLRRPVLPGREPGAGADRGHGDLRAGVLLPPARRDAARPLRRPARPQGRDAADHPADGRRLDGDRDPAHLRAGRLAGADPAAARPDRPGDVAGRRGLQRVGLPGRDRPAGPPRPLLVVLLHLHRLGAAAASLLGVLLTNVLTQDQLEGYGWRIAFFIGGLLGLVGMWLRRSLVETEQFEENAEKARRQAPLLQTITHHPKAVLSCARSRCCRPCPTTRSSAP